MLPTGFHSTSGMRRTPVLSQNKILITGLALGFPVEIVLKHYFRSGRTEFKAALTGAMPAVLTGGKPKRLKPADELAALSGKLAAGSATDEDKARLRKLAAAV
jgi:hypothetical protein